MNRIGDDVKAPAALSSNSAHDDAFRGEGPNSTERRAQQSKGAIVRSTALTSTEHKTQLSVELLATEASEQQKRD